MVTFHYPFYKTQLEPAPNQKQMDLCMEEVSLAAGSSSTLSPIAHRPRGRAPGLTLPLYLLYTYIIDIYFLPIFTAYPASSFRIVSGPF